MAQYALSWGSGTHFDDAAFIGKLGFGLPNASINQTRLVEVYTKIEGAAKITKATLDARRVSEFGLQEIPEPEEADLPEFVRTYLDKNGVAFDHGTVVVWVNPDRLSFRTAALLREHLVDDFGVTYRYILPRVDITVDATKVQPVDPLFLTPGARYYIPTEEGGAEMTKDCNLAVKYFQDRETGTLCHGPQLVQGARMMRLPLLGKRAARLRFAVRLRAQVHAARNYLRRGAKGGRAGA